ncbi:hypothetical protein B0T10DRAFT_565623 [Thelonectria olida]|uniref:Uncharacterized protein n=1 Tax=Thelonectria olida TaxID=1576542 RepID=A0A9P9AHK0_9HYPO|nr:hypothetical protein B0T10DRAFT_565623 [Thelonectria olida]
MCLPNLFRKKKRGVEPPVRQSTPTARPLIPSQPAQQSRRRTAVPKRAYRQDNSLAASYFAANYASSHDYGGTYGGGYVGDDGAPPRNDHGHSGHGHDHGHGNDHSHGHDHGYSGGHDSHSGGHDSHSGGWGGGHDSGGGGGGDGGGGGGGGGD